MISNFFCRIKITLYTLNDYAELYSISIQIPVVCLRCLIRSWAFLYLECTKLEAIGALLLEVHMSSS